MNNRPKRRKSNDNPYTLQIINNTYVVIFRDGSRKEQVVEVSEKIFNQMDHFELEDISQMHKIGKHLDKYSYIEEVLYQKSINKPKMIEDIVEERIISEKFREAISSLSPVQKRRIIKYYFNGKDEYEIAKEENALQQSVHIILCRALENLKKILKN